MVNAILMASGIAVTLFVFWFVGFVKTTKKEIKRLLEQHHYHDEWIKQLQLSWNKTQKPKYIVGKKTVIKCTVPCSCGCGCGCNVRWHFDIKAGVIIEVKEIKEKGIITGFEYVIFDASNNSKRTIGESLIDFKNIK